MIHPPFLRFRRPRLRGRHICQYFIYSTKFEDYNTPSAFLGQRKSRKGGACPDERRANATVRGAHEML
jgi:hypothetical protein